MKRHSSLKSPNHNYLPPLNFEENAFLYMRWYLHEDAALENEGSPYASEILRVLNLVHDTVRFFCKVNAQQLQT